MKLVICLGNVGTKFAGTYHNVGFDVADLLADIYGHKKFKSKARYSTYFKESGFIVAKPTTYMNRSGNAALELMTRFKIKPENVLAIYDEFDLPSGTFKFKDSGSGGTHNGARDLVYSIGEKFNRLKIGIKPPVKIEVPLDAFVLSRMEPGEREKIRDTVKQVAEEVVKFVKE